MTAPITVPVWHVHGDSQHELGTAEVTLDPDTGEATITAPNWDDNATARLDAAGAGTETECFLILELDDAPGREPLQVLAFPVDRYRPAKPAQHGTVRIPGNKGCRKPV